MTYTRLDYELLVAMPWAYADSTCIHQYWISLLLDDEHSWTVNTNNGVYRVL